MEVRDGQLVITTVPDLHDAPDNILESAVAFQEDRAYVSFSRPDSHGKIMRLLTPRNWLL